MTTPRLIAFDLDGTLAESKQPLEPSMAGILAHLLERLPLAVMSGAGFPQFEKQFLASMPEKAHFERLYIFPTNAAQCYLFANGSWRIRYDKKFSPEEREKILDALSVSMKETGFDKPPPEVWGKRIEDRGAQITFSHFGQEAPLKVKGPWDPTREKRRPLFDALVKRLPEFAIGLNATNSIDITHHGITKAYGVKRLADLTGIPISDMLYVGDALFEGGNDSVVKESGIETHAVKNPQDTARFLKKIILSFPQGEKKETNAPATSPVPSMRTRDWSIITVIAVITAIALAFLGRHIASSLSAAPALSAAETTASTTADSSSKETPPVSSQAVTSLAEPLPNSVISSPLTVTGSARGTWFFEAQFPVTLKDANGTVLARTPAHAQGNAEEGAAVDWQTTGFVPFSAVLDFAKPSTATGILVLQNDNPSGDPSKQQEIDIPVRFK